MNSANTKKWQRLRTHNTPPSTRNCHTATLVNNLLVIFGGKEGENPKNIVNDVHILNLDNLEWKQGLSITGDFPTPRMGHTAVLVGKKILVYGGWNGMNVLDDLYSFEVATMHWQKLDTTGEAPKRQFHTAHVIGSKMFVFGGGDGKNWLNSLHCLNLRNLEWSLCRTGGTVPPGRLQHCSVVHRKKLFVFGGEPDRQAQLDDFYVLNTKNLDWTQVTRSEGPSARVSCACAIANDSLFVFGGFDGDKWLNDLYEFDINTKEWSLVTPGSKVPAARCRHTANLYKHKIYIFGGNDSERSFKDVWALKVFSQRVKVKEGQLTNNMKEMLDQEAFCDVTFRVEGKEVKAHKCILCARSEHFRAMLTAGMRESYNESIEIPDISYRVFLKLLEFIYTDHLEIKQGTAEEILTVANMFLLERLKNLCEDSLSETICIENIVELLVLADRHQATELKKVCVDFAIRNFETVVKLPNFENLPKRIMVELLRCRPI